MPNYGYRLTFTHDGFATGTQGVKRVEFEAQDRHAADAALTGWATVNGYRITSRELLADGMTFREAGKRRAVNMAAELSLRYGVGMEGPFDIPGDAVVVRVVLPNGKGVSLATDGPLGYDPAPALEALVFDDRGYGEPVRDVDLPAVEHLIKGLM
jgi:hypothetical protein